MHEPLYKPEHWILYQQGDNGGFGQIVGGTFGADGWHYTLRGIQLDTTLTSVSENDIIFAYEQNSWIAPTHLGGAGSAYTD